MPAAGVRGSVVGGELFEHRGCLVGVDGIEEHLVDVGVSRPAKLVSAVLEVLSFAGERKDWTPVEYDAGRFLYGCRRAGVEARAVVVPPAGDEQAVASFERVRRWLDQEEIPTVGVADVLATPQQALELEEPATA